MCFYLKYDLHSCSSFLFQKLSPPKFRSTYSTLVNKMQDFVWYINMVLILRTQRIEKSLLEISRLNLSTEFGGVQKCILASWNCVFSQPLQFRSYATYETILTVQRLINVFLIWNMYYTRFLLLFQNL
jgi:hypothetical protein